MCEPSLLPEEERGRPRPPLVPMMMPPCPVNPEWDQEVCMVSCDPPIVDPASQPVYPPIEQININQEEEYPPHPPPLRMRMRMPPCPVDPEGDQEICAVSCDPPFVLDPPALPVYPPLEQINISQEDEYPRHPPALPVIDLDVANLTPDPPLRIGSCPTGISGTRKLSEGYEGCPRGISGTRKLPEGYEGCPRGISGTRKSSDDYEGCPIGISGSSSYSDGYEGCPRGISGTRSAEKDEPVNQLCEPELHDLPAAEVPMRRPINWCGTRSYPEVERLSVGEEECSTRSDAPSPDRDSPIIVACNLPSGRKLQGRPVRKCGTVVPEVTLSPEEVGCSTLAEKMCYNIIAAPPLECEPDHDFDATGVMRKMF